MKLILIVIALAACSHSQPEPSSELAARRAQMLGYLADYTERGEFPTDERGLPLSVFKDSHGVRCPMAELMYRSGEADLVDAIAAEDNHARLADIHEGPVHDWMLGSGLTRDEIIMIQGIADISYNHLQFRNTQPENVITAQRERVRGRLETAQAALRKDERASLTAATAQLPRQGVPAVRVARPVLAKRAQ